MIVLGARCRAGPCPAARRPGPRDMRPRPHPGRPARGRRPARPRRRWLLEAGCELDVRRPYAGDALPDDLDGLRRPAGARRRDGRQRRRPALVADPDQGPDPRRGASDAADARHLPGPPARRHRAGRRVGRATRAASRSACSTSAGPHAAAADPLLAACQREPRRGVQWNYDVVDPLPTGADRAGGRPRTARCRPRASGRRPGACSCTPRSTRRSSAAWVTDDERTELADRGLDADGILADIEAARAELDEAWQPLAEAFARLVHQHAASSVGDEQAADRPGPPDPPRLRRGRGRPSATSPRSATPRSRWSPCWRAPRTRTRRSRSWSG